MDIFELEHQMERLGCAVRYCGPHGLIFTNDFCGGLRPHKRGLHFWDGVDNCMLDFKEVRNCLSELPAKSGEFAVRRVLSRLAWRG